MGRKNHTGRRQVKVTREVIALAVLAEHAAKASQAQDPSFLPGRVYGSRKITGRMLKALRAQVV